ncbi:alpha-ketoglutarate-dependent dioxygenase AlkB family protein [Xanthomarina sp. F2636L]|uniref:alpha-ketoglutarate-dependent dioxygenase AlkB family protein n=1 Tax=Xanthomarina sp. F2636L TaxID=2996018 RepID=UPI00225E6C7D|nr:alpha-ketoglutarate-dependent dioxygenase AlkB [Xanthomarina sp. F2636L]MCX7550615.1 alpha-ketoglutarate-dependent dioxygenase AlkB [Xanthomarina sp. F2636L]
MDLFSSEKTSFKLPQAELIYIPQFYNQSQADKLFKILLEQVLWQQDNITIFGKTHKQPRLTALYSEDNKSYSYSGITMNPNPFSSLILSIKQEIELFTKHKFNSVLINLYRDGSDSNGWHADNEKELGLNPTIASVSFGAKRTFKFRHRTLKHEKHQLKLEHGSLLIMTDEMQHYWLHQIPKTKKDIGKRINLTFRFIA